MIICYRLDVYNPEMATDSSSLLKDQWLKAGLEKEFPYIQPDSDLAVLIIDLFEAQENTNQICDDYAEGPIERWQQALNDHMLDLQRFGVMENMLNSTNYDLAKAQKTPIVQKNYRQIVSRNCSKAISHIAYKKDTSTVEKRNQTFLAKTIAHLLLAENCHFHAHINASFEKLTHSPDSKS